MTSPNSIRIGVIVDKPFSDQCLFQHTCSHGGLAYDAAVLTCELLNLNCTFHDFKFYDYGSVDGSGNLTGLLGAVQDGRFDTTLPYITPTHDRFQAIHFSASYFFFDNVLVTRMPKPKTDVQLDWNIVESFEWPVWFALIIAFICSQSVMAAVDYARRREWKLNIRATIPFDFENRKRRFDRVSDRLIYMTFSVLEFMFVCTYAGIMYSNQVAGKETLPFVDLDTFIQCLADDRCRLIVPTLSYSSFEFLKAQGGSRLARVLNETPPVVVSMNLIPDAIIGNEDVFLTWLIPKLFYTSLTKNNRDCKFYDVTVPFFDVNTFAMRKNDSHLRDMMDKAAGLLQQHGMLAAIESKYQVNVDLCGQLNDIAPVRSMRVLTIRTIQAALAFYACGVLGSFALFGLERAVARIMARIWTVAADREYHNAEDAGGCGDDVRPNSGAGRAESSEPSAEINL